MSRKLIPSWIYCPKCGEKVMLNEITDTQILNSLRLQGYEAGARGICECGVVLILCVQPMPASPTFSLFFDVYQPTEEFLGMRKAIIEQRR